MDAANCAAVLLSVPISYHFHGFTALQLVALVVVSGAILNTHLYLYLFVLTRALLPAYQCVYVCVLLMYY